MGLVDLLEIARLVSAVSSRNADSLAQVRAPGSADRAEGAYGAVPLPRGGAPRPVPEPVVPEPVVPEPVVPEPVVPEPEDPVLGPGDPATELALSGTMRRWQVPTSGAVARAPVAGSFAVSRVLPVTDFATKATAPALPKSTEPFTWWARTAK